MNTVTTGPDSTMFVHVSGGCGIRDGMLATLKAEIQERQDIVDVLEAANFERFKAMHAKMAAKAMDNALQVGEQQLYGELPRPVHGDAIAKVRGKIPTTGAELRKALRAAKRATKRHRRTPEDIEAMGKKLLAYVTKNPGQRGETIAKALGTDVGTMRKPMKSLGYLIRTKGKRRGTTYYAK